MYCPNCGKANSATNINCEYCGAQIIDDLPIDQSESSYDTTIPSSPATTVQPINVNPKTVGCLANIIFLFITGPFLLTGLAFLGVGLFCTYNEQSQTKGYIETTATFQTHDNCYIKDGNTLCNAVYEYEVNGLEYTVSPSHVTNEGDFPGTETVYYNPSNPSESLIYSEWQSLTITGAVILAVILVIFIVKTIIVRKLPKNITISNRISQVQQ